jgi:hypothetical protein
VFISYLIVHFYCFFPQVFIKDRTERKEKGADIDRTEIGYGLRWKWEWRWNNNTKQIVTIMGEAYSLSSLSSLSKA